MAVEALTIINGPLAGVGVEENGVVGWMHQHGINPTYVGVGAIAGAVLNRRGFVNGAITGAAVVFLGSFLWDKIR